MTVESGGTWGEFVGKAALFLFALVLTRPIWCSALLVVDLALSAVADSPIDGCVESV